MGNLRILDVNAADSRTIKVKFSDNLSLNINKTNISILSELVNIPNVQVTGTSISNNILIINTLPQTPYARYNVIFSSTEAISFCDKSGTKYLLEDGISNVAKVLGAENDYCPTRSRFIDYLGGEQTIYDLSRETLVRDYLNNVSTMIDKAKADIRQAKSANYLEFFVKDEKKIRRFGPWDRLNQEGAFEIVRVGTTPTDETIDGIISFTSFPTGLITLQSVSVTNEELILGTGTGTFTSDLVLTLNRYPVTKITSIQIIYESGDIYNYNIRSLGYRINNPKYDEQYARRLITLNENQVKLNDSLKEDPLFVIPGGNDTIIVSYEYKSLGKLIKDSSVAVTEIIEVVREAAPALITMFSLKNAPIITSSDKTPTNNGIEFLDPYCEVPFMSTHPAFLYEIPYREGGYPSMPGQYSVDYETGRVFVYGAIDNDGTGNFPPAMNYNYRKIYGSRLDYTYVPEYKDLVASPLRDLIGKPAKITFKYEMTLVPDVDYVANVHIEEQNERVENRLASLDSLYTKYSPITDAFKIYNETTGEIYPITRHTDNKVYFTYRNAPRIRDSIRERVSFTDVLNEDLIVSSELSGSVRVFKIDLLNSNIINSTEDAIGASFNSSATFSQTDIFSTELYYDYNELTELENINRLSVGQYQINYKNGIVYVGVINTQTYNLGTISYKKSTINPVHSHVMSVSNLYCSINANYTNSKILEYTSFGEDEIVPTQTMLDVSDERYLSNNTEDQYVLESGIITVTDDIKNIRGIYDVYNLNNSSLPINFAESASYNANVITMDSVGVQQTIQLSVSAGRIVTIPFISNGIDVTSISSVIRVTDNRQLLDGYQTVNENVITLSTTCGGVVGDIVRVIYNVTLNSACTPVIDYNRGDFFVDYSYLLDELLVTYEWGDNVIDHRQSNVLKENDNYYVSYKIGALRNELLQNFGSLVRIDELQVFDDDLDRETYRDILQGALQTFTKGPTIQAITELVSNITKIDPRIVEAAFWSLGVSYLDKKQSEVLGDPTLVAGPFDQGVLINKIGDGITLPISNNLRLEEGSMEMSIVPEWDGIDNDATITLELFKNGIELDSSEIYIGASSFHPTIENGIFTVNRTDNNSPIGIPAALFTSTGLFVYYDVDIKCWKVFAKDIPTINDLRYTGTITTSGSFYNVKFVENLNESSDRLRSGIKKISFVFNVDGYDLIGQDGYDSEDPNSIMTGYSFDGIQFMSDDHHYFFDFGTNENQNRFSLYKDGRGYLIFEVWDKGGFGSIKPNRRNVYQVSADIQDWVAGETHDIGISWILNSSDKKDEMHLFVDGFETPNIARYGNVPTIVTTERFRTIVPEQIVGMVTKNSVTGNDLVISSGSDWVTSPISNFTASGIIPGDTIEILESGYSSYVILAVNGTSLQLNYPLTGSLSNARFSVNPVEIIIGTEIDIYKNIGVFILETGGEETEIPGTRAELPSYSIERNALNQRILKILGNVNAGDTVLIKTFGLNHRRCRDNIYLWSDGSTIKTALPPPINLDDVSIKPISLPLTSIESGNSVIVDGYFIANLDGYTQPSNQIEGRYYNIKITGDNTNFSTAPVTVILTGSSTGGTTETLTFTSAGMQTTTYRWRSFSNIYVSVLPRNIMKPAAAIEIKETYSITEPNGNNIYPVIRFAYQTQSGLSLSGTGNSIVTDINGYFPLSEIGHLIEITTPPSVAGIYKIEDRIDNTTIRLDRDLGTSFTDGAYNCFNISIGRSGFQNGFFFFERAGFTNISYTLPTGWYEIDYATNLEVPFDPINQIGIIGNDITLQKPAKSIIDEVRVLNRQLTDTRIGETIADTEESFTTGANKFSSFVKNQDTLSLLHFETLPPKNDSDFYKFATKEYVQSGESVNSKFGHSIVLKNKGLVFDNKGMLDTSNEGTIEFWVSPRFDTYNDPNVRVYFDAAANIVEEVTSLTKGRVKVSRNISEIVYVRLENDTNLSGIEFFNGGTIESDGKTIILNSPLPFQNTPVHVAYIPTGVQGDRLTIAKDGEGFISFTVSAQGKEYQTRQPVFWPRNTWHRVRASFKFNRKDNIDEIRLFIDGEERGSVLFGQGDLLFGQGVIWGQAAIGGVTNNIYTNDINFTDTVMQFSLGQDYAGCFGAEARFDNLKLSNKAISPIVVSGQPMDVYFNTNKEYIYPSIEDAFTTFLFDFDQYIEKTEDVAVIRNPIYGVHNFDLDIIDSFNIVSGDQRVKTVLEAMIKALKPATSKVGLKYYT
jgi:hypothetical protein